MPHPIYLLPAFFISLFTVSLHAQQLPEPHPTTKSITHQDLRAHVEWLSSDELEGRGTGSAAIDRAAEYLAREFKRFGLLPAGDDGYFQTFEVVTGVRRTSSVLAIARNGRESAVDTLGYIPCTFSATTAFAGRAVFAGYGISGGHGSANDYEDVDAAGAVAIVLHGMPADTDPHSAVAIQATARSKALAAREAGASALLIIQDGPVAAREFRWDGSSSNAGIPVARINRASAVSLLLAAGIDTSALSSAASAQGKRSDVTISGTFGVEVVRAKTRNVAALLPGRNAARDDQTIVVGAHYDHLGWGQEGSLYRGAEPMIHNGADDNASGTAGVLELAEHFVANPPERSMLFLAFSGEEMGLLGSMHWVANPTLPLSRVIAMFNLDMIGRLPDSTRRLHVQGVGTSPVWSELVKARNTDYAFDLALIEDGQGSSDHSSFYAKGIPVLFFFTGLHTDYHRPGDDAEKLNYEGQEAVTRYVADIIHAVDGADAPEFTRVERKAEQREMRFTVYVGTIPDYAHSGEGFRIGGASPGSPAEKSGMREGDIILRFGETSVGNIYDYMAALGRHSPGETVPVIVRRGEESVELRVELVSK